MKKLLFLSLSFVFLIQIQAQNKLDVDGGADISGLLEVDSINCQLVLCIDSTGKIGYGVISNDAGFWQLLGGLLSYVDL